MNFTSPFKTMQTRSVIGNNNQGTITHRSAQNKANPFSNFAQAPQSLFHVQSNNQSNTSGTQNNVNNMFRPQNTNTFQKPATQSTLNFKPINSMPSVSPSKRPNFSQTFSLNQSSQNKFQPASSTSNTFQKSTTPTFQFGSQSTQPQQTTFKGFQTTGQSSFATTQQNSNPFSTTQVPSFGQQKPVFGNTNTFGTSQSSSFASKPFTTAGFTTTSQQQNNFGAPSIFGQNQQQNQFSGGMTGQNFDFNQIRQRISIPSSMSKDQSLRSLQQNILSVLEQEWFFQLVPNQQREIIQNAFEQFDSKVSEIQTAMLKKSIIDKSEKTREDFYSNNFGNPLFEMQLHELTQQTQQKFLDVQNCIQEQKAELDHCELLLKQTQQTIDDERDPQSLKTSLRWNDNQLANHKIEQQDVTRSVDILKYNHFEKTQDAHHSLVDNCQQFDYALTRDEMEQLDISFRHLCKIVENEALEIEQEVLHMFESMLTMTNLTKKSEREDERNIVQSDSRDSVVSKVIILLESLSDRAMKVAKNSDQTDEDIENLREKYFRFLSSANIGAASIDKLQRDYDIRKKQAMQNVLVSEPSFAGMKTPKKHQKEPRQSEDNRPVTLLEQSYQKEVINRGKQKRDIFHRPLGGQNDYNFVGMSMYSERRKTQPVLYNQDSYLPQSTPLIRKNRQAIDGRIKTASQRQDPIFQESFSAKVDQNIGKSKRNPLNFE